MYMKILRSNTALCVLQPNYTAIIHTCNLWRNFDDIQDSWDSVQRIIDYYGDNQDEIVRNAGPGHWNDPDMVKFSIMEYVKENCDYRETFGRLLILGRK